MSFGYAERITGKSMFDSNSASRASLTRDRSAAAALRRVGVAATVAVNARERQSLTLRAR